MMSWSKAGSVVAARPAASRFLKRSSVFGPSELDRPSDSGCSATERRPSKLPGCRSSGRVSLAGRWECRRGPEGPRLSRPGPEHWSGAGLLLVVQWVGCPLDDDLAMAHVVQVAEVDDRNVAIAAAVDVVGLAVVDVDHVMTASSEHGVTARQGGVRLRQGVDDI